jgi:UDP-glucuronate decarboxylase
MRVLVTGAAGFLGSHLSRWHLNRGDHVTGVDDHSSSQPDSPHLARLRAEEDFDFYQESTCDSAILGMKFRQKIHQFDLIYNFGCPASPPTYQKLAIHTLNTCFNGTRNILDIARAHGSRVVHASTSEVYGDPAMSPQKESYRGCVNSFGPRACYDEGKRVAEALIFEYQQKYDVDARLVRIFNTYGPHMDPNDGRVVTNFVRQALAGEDITVYGDGQQTRSFCYVTDLVSGITDLAARCCDPELRNPINLGNPEEFTILQLAQTVITMADSESKIVHKPLPTDDPLQRRPDISWAKELLDWEPQIRLDVGLRKMINHFLIHR